MPISADITALEGVGYQFEQMLSTDQSDRSFLCLDERGKPVVMKRLEADCLHRDQLHPAIRDRLARVRELPHPRLAILRGVERFGSDVYLVWNFLAGTCWDQTDMTAEVWLDRARELISAVDLLHTQGIVHGSLHGKNIIAAENGDIWLTDVSPYLYDDPIVDIDAVVSLLHESTDSREDLSGARDALAKFDANSDTLRDLAGALSADPVDMPTVRSSPDGARWRSVAAVVAVLCICAAAAFFLHSRFR